LDFDNGSEFLNKAVIKWAGEMEIFFTGCASSAGWPSAA
jgi:hypothetical protein